MNAGIDEAGRGCIFGHVFASAVLWDDSITHNLLKDSKKLSKNQRLIMYDFILDNAIDYGIGFSTNLEIDSLNINNANILAMHRALNNLQLSPDFIYVDGISFSPYNNIPHECFIGGDNLFNSISAASILAKVSHDTHINEELAKNNSWHIYGLSTNMGYATKIHCDSVQQNGRTSLHRHSFKLPFEKKFNTS